MSSLPSSSRASEGYGSPFEAGATASQGYSVCDGGLVIDLSRMKSVRVNPGARTAIVEAGALWADVDRECHAFGLATTGGMISHTGVAGLTLGGGFGWLSRKHGMVVDNLLSVELVTAEGQFARADAKENRELFWALRGGGGNFGIATTFEYRLHPAPPTMLAGLVGHPLPKAGEALKFLHEFNKSAPDDLSTVGAFLTTPEGHPAFGIAFCYSGPQEKAEAVVKPLMQYGPPVMKQVGPMPYPVVQTMLNQSAEPGRRYYIRADLLKDLPQGIIDGLAGQFAKVPSPLSVVLVIQMGGGAMARVAKEDTAFAHRDITYAVTAIGGWTNPAEDQANVGWVRGCSEAIRPFTPGMVYVNELGDEGEERIRQAYPPKTYARLAALKHRYDSANFFRLNQNIAPQAAK